MALVGVTRPRSASGEAGSGPGRFFVVFDRFVPALLVAEESFARSLVDALDDAFLTDGWALVEVGFLLKAIDEDMDDGLDEVPGVGLVGEVDRALSGFDSALFPVSFISEVDSEGKVGVPWVELSEVLSRRCLSELVGAAAEAGMVDVGRAGGFGLSFGIVLIVEDLIKCLPSLKFFPFVGVVFSLFGSDMGIEILDRSLVLPVGETCAILAGLLYECKYRKLESEMIQLNHLALMSYVKKKHVCNAGVFIPRS